MIGFWYAVATMENPFPAAPVNPTQTVADRFYALCNEGKFDQAMADLYADDARHVEAMEMPGTDCKRITEGKPALLKMAEQFNKSTTIHSCWLSKPLVNGDQFVCEMKMDSTSHAGPFAGQRMQVQEYCVYTVRGDKITEAKFFYGC